MRPVRWRWATCLLLIAATFVAGVAPVGVQMAWAGSRGIRVYTWIDARGVTHFSDVPRTGGKARLLVLPTPPPADQTALAAQRAWADRMARETEQDLIQRATERRRTQRQAEAVASTPIHHQSEVQYVPVFFAHGHHLFRHRHSSRDADDRRLRRLRLPSVGFPANRLPSSFPGGLPNSFPNPLASSFPRPPGRPMPPN